MVVPDSEGQLLAFIYYQKRNGQANRLNALASQQAITSLRQQLEQDTGSALDGLTALQSGLQSLTAALMQLGLDEMAAQVTSMAASQKPVRPDSGADAGVSVRYAGAGSGGGHPEEVESHQLSNLYAFQVLARQLLPLDGFDPSAAGSGTETGRRRRNIRACLPLVSRAV